MLLGNQLAGPQALGAAEEGRPARPGYAPTPEERQLIQIVESRINYQNRDTSRWAIERQYFESIAFYLGIQWIEYSVALHRHIRYKAPSWVPTPVSNAIKPRANAMKGRLLRSRPQGRVRPNSADIRDRQAAQVSERFIQHVYDVTHEMDQRQLAADFAVLTGTVIAKDYFNPQAGNRVRIPRTYLDQQPIMQQVARCPSCGAREPGERVESLCMTCGGLLEAATEPALQPDGNPAMVSRRLPQVDPITNEPLYDEVAEGEIETQALMLFNFYWDPKARSLKDAQWCGEATYVDIDWIDRNFPDAGPYVGVEVGVDPGSFYESSLLALIGSSIQGTAYGGGQQRLRRGAVLRIMEEKPSVAFPDGRHVITANGVLLYNGTLPIRANGRATGDFSYTEFRFDTVPGRFLGTTPVEDMVPLQRRINGIDAQIIVNRKTLVQPWILAPKGSGLNPGQVHMRPGATVTYNYIGVGAAPQVVPGTPLPNQVMEERVKCIEHMDMLAEDPRVTGLQPVQQMRSGVGLHWLKEQIDEAGIPRLERWAQWIAERDRKRLLLAAEYYREDRAIRVLGEGSQWQIQMWRGADLRGNTDVVIDPGSLVPRSRSATTQVIFDLIEAGVINPADPMEKQKIIEELQLRRFDTQMGPDRRRATVENAMMDEGMAVEVNPEDDHDVHAMEHLAEMKEPRFLSKLPQIQMLYRQHKYAHDVAKFQLQQAQMEGNPSQAGEQPKAQVSIGEEPSGEGTSRDGLPMAA